MSSGFLTDKVRPARAATRMDNETYRIRVEDLFRELHDEEGQPNEAVKAQLKELALLPRKTRHFLRVLNDQPLQVQTEFYLHVLREVKAPDFYKDLERHIRHRFYEAREEIKQLLASLTDENAIEALMHVIALTEEGWLAGELIRIVLAHEPELARVPVRNALDSGDYLLQCLGIYLAGKSKKDPLLEELGSFYRKPQGEKVDQARAQVVRCAHGRVRRCQRRAASALAQGFLGPRTRGGDYRSGAAAAESRGGRLDQARLGRRGNSSSGRPQTLLDFEEEGLLAYTADDEGGRAMAAILSAAKQEPLMKLLTELSRDESAAVREVAVKLMQLLPDPKPVASVLVRSAAEDRARSVPVGGAAQLGTRRQGTVF